jgi:hypothetical protein
MLRNAKLKAVNNLNATISEILFISTNDEIINSIPAIEIANIGGQIVRLKNKLKDIKI